ncbi:hypothetical protein NDU88_007189 [Pleurodeles waltl]|uniref:Uncharacterized protein n=1 Tax=Pleurodeles waltl TaxID=8319 RepID=A0AAV7RPD3_PLEWA|nr:hypothetical protein NDU88_007189 [Pleurodeles waltl]
MVLPLPNLLHLALRKRYHSSVLLPGVPLTRLSLFIPSHEYCFCGFPQHSFSKGSSHQQSRIGSICTPSNANPEQGISTHWSSTALGANDGPHGSACDLLPLNQATSPCVDRGLPGSCVTDASSTHVAFSGHRSRTGLFCARWPEVDALVPNEYGAAPCLKSVPRGASGGVDTAGCCRIRPGLRGAS